MAWGALSHSAGRRHRCCACDLAGHETHRRRAPLAPLTRGYWTRAVGGRPCARWRARRLGQARTIFYRDTHGVHALDERLPR